jgi:D-beta-D-heptose 7-phosphate kinase/D-beta-D-heptose 1-phosphate adenosyltransferase
MELKSSEKISVKYHDIFDFKLTKEESIRWQYKQSLPSYEGKNQRKGKKQLQREKYSQKKLAIAKKASGLISKIPNVLFVGITGSLAMMNSGKDSDIDLLIITSHGRLWLTRLLVYYTLNASRFTLRRPRVDNERDALCLNMWLDESDLVWVKKDRNIYTAHEIAQVVPLVNKEKTYEKFLYLNRWILNYWPNSVKIRRYKEKVISPDSSFLSLIPLIFEKFFFRLQYLYMFKKITREIITPTRAIFHPNDWGKKVLMALKVGNC